MYGTTEQFNKAILGDTRKFKINITCGENESTSEIKDLVMHSFVADDKKFTIGGALSSYVEITLWNPGFKFEKKEFFAEIGIDTEDGTEWCPLGYFMADKVRKGTDGLLNFQAYDRMYTKLYGAYFSDLKYPTDAKNVLAEIAQKTGVEVDMSNLEDGVIINPKKVIAESEIDTTGNKKDKITYEEPFNGYTYREALGYIAMLYCKYAIIDRDGKVKFIWYTESDYNITDDYYNDDFEAAETAFTVGKITCNTSEEELEIGKGTNNIQLENPIMTAERLAVLYENIKNLQFIPVSFSFYGDIRIEACDLISVTRPDGIYKVPIMEVTQDFDGGLKTTVQSYGGSEQESTEKGPILSRIDRQYTELILVKEIVGKKANFDYVYALNAEFKVLQADSANFKNTTTEKLQAVSADILSLKATSITTDKLSTELAKIGVLTAEEASLKYATIANLNATDAKINSLQSIAITTDNLSAKVATLGYATVKELDVEKARINTLEIGTLKMKDLAAEVAKLGYATIDQLNATNAELDTVKANQITTEYLKANYASIDLANVKAGSITTAMIGTGAVGTAQIADGSITDAKIVSLTANKITAGTLDAAQIEVINLNAANITAGVITADRIALKSIDSSKLSDTLNGTITSAKDTANSALSQIEGLEIGGRNLLLESGVTHSNSTYGMARYYFGDEKPIEGEQYTITLKGTLGSDRDSFRVYNSGGLVMVCILTNKGNGLYSWTGKWIVNVATNTYIQVYQFQNTGTSASTIEWIKLEKGNKATDWTPAPEDTESSISEAKTLANNAIATASTAQSTADGKNTVFYQTSAPSTTGRRRNDVWFDTDDGHKMYYFNGTGWESKQFGTSAIANASIVNALIADATIQSAKIANLDAGKITSGYISADRINTGSITYAKLDSAAVSAINALVEVGGRNLIYDTRSMKKWIYGSKLTVTYDQDDCNGGKEAIKVINADGTGGNAWLEYKYDDEKVFTTGVYTASFYAKKEDDSRAIIELMTNGNVRREMFELSTTWERYYVTFEYSTDVSGKSNLCWLNFINTNTIYFSHFKLERGNKATDWTPAPEDVEAEISEQGIGNWCYNNNLSYINGGKIYTGTVTANAIAANAITAGKIATNAVTAGTIAASAVTTDKIAANAITAAKIASRTITADKIVAGAITGNEIAAKTITANNIVANTITATSGIIADAAITNAKIASLDAAKITSGYISADRINTGSITYAKLDSAAVSAINALVEVGGRNLLLESGVTHSNSTYGMARYYFGDEKPIEGEQYTITLKGTLGSDRDSFRVYNSGGLVMVCILTNKGNGLYSWTGKWIVNVATNTYIQVYQFQNTGTSASTIEWIKLEKGNKATDWTPAPEDVEAEISEQGIGNWCYNNNLSYINGGKIYTGTVTANAIAANAVTADKISVSTLSAITANLGTVNSGIIQSPTYSYSSGVYSTSGMQIGLSGAGYIRAKNFALDSSGNAYIKGSIDATSLLTKTELKVYSSNSSDYESVVKATSWDANYKTMLFGFTGSTDSFMSVQKSVKSKGGHIAIGGANTDVAITDIVSVNSDGLTVFGDIIKNGTSLDSLYADKYHSHTTLDKPNFTNGMTLDGLNIFDKIVSGIDFAYIWRVTASGNLNPYMGKTNTGQETAGEVNIGNTNTYIKNLYYGGSLSKQSDRRIKNDLGDITEKEALTLLKYSRPKKFTYKSDKDQIVQYGAYAQDVRDLLKSSGIGHTALLGIDIDGEDGVRTKDLNYPESKARYSLDYEQYISPLIVGWQNHDRRLSELESRIAKLTTENAQIRAENAQLLARIEKMEEEIA